MAATKIQAAHRGRAARKEVQAMREQEAAATKIQAVHRGRATRKQLKGAHASHDFVESTGMLQCCAYMCGYDMIRSLSM